MIKKTSLWILLALPSVSVLAMDDNQKFTILNSSPLYHSKEAQDFVINVVRFKQEVNDIFRNGVFEPEFLRARMIEPFGKICELYSLIIINTKQLKQKNIIINFDEENELRKCLDTVWDQFKHKRTIIELFECNAKHPMMDNYNYVCRFTKAYKAMKNWRKELNLPKKQ